MNGIPHDASTSHSNSIRPLDPSVKSVLRAQTNLPSYADAISELIQNSVDANATWITVRLDPSTLSFTVEDNGLGIRPDDFPLLGSPYHTSKCTSSNFSKGEFPYLGFRGEALSSIASTSFLSITSRYLNSDETHTIHVKRGISIASHRVIGQGNEFVSCGTSISVNCLHSSLPVRYRILSCEKLSVHMNSLKQAILPLLSSNPNVCLKVLDYIKGSTLLSVPPASPYSNTPREVTVLSCFYGRQSCASWSSVLSTNGLFSLNGIVVLTSKTISSAQYIIINRRLVKIPHLYRMANSLIISQYGGNKKSPFSAVFVLSIKGPLAPTSIFSEPQKVVTQLENLDTVTELISSALTSYATYSFSQREEESPRKGGVSTHKNKGGTLSNLPSTLTKATGNQDYYSHFSRFFSKKHVDEIDTLSQKISKHQLANCKVITQVDSKFILAKVPLAAETQDIVLVMIDQHAADERIRVERLVVSFMNSTDLQSPKLLAKPVTLFLGPEEMQIISEHRISILKWGTRFQLIPDDGKIKVTHVPSLLEEEFLLSSQESLFRDLTIDYAYQLSTTHSTNGTDQLRYFPSSLVKYLNTRACKGAIKFGDTLDLDQCKELVTDLVDCKFPFQCAHGRPSLIPLVTI